MIALCRQRVTTIDAAAAAAAVVAHQIQDKMDGDVANGMPYSSYQCLPHRHPMGLHLDTVNIPAHYDNTCYAKLDHIVVVAAAAAVPLSWMDAVDTHNIPVPLRSLLVESGVVAVVVGTVQSLGHAHRDRTYRTVSTLAPSLAPPMQSEREVSDKANQSMSSNKLETLQREMRCNFPLTVSS